MNAIKPRQRIGDWIQTFSGRQFWPADPDPDEVNVYDIAHALSLLCRFGGHTKKFYSVAEHCVILSYAVPEHYALWALLHDASEAYVVDIPRPLKRMLGDYRFIEDKVIAAIARRFELDSVAIPDTVSEYDTRILLDERDQLMHPGTAKWTQDGLGPLGIKCLGWNPERAERNYLDRLEQLIPWQMFRSDYIPPRPRSES